MTEDVFRTMDLIFNTLSTKEIKDASIQLQELSEDECNRI